MPLRRVALVLSLLAISTSALADAPRIYGGHYAPPKCDGTDKATADKELTEGIAHYKRAKATNPNDPTELAAALAAFEASCAAGNDLALEFRAYALAGMQRWVDAAETLDVFLSLHPLESLDPAVRDRVQMQQGAILSQVTSLTVESKPRPARVMINHHDMGMSPLSDVRLEPGTYDLELITDETSPSIKRTVSFGVGPHTETFDLDTPAEAPRAVDVTPVAETPKGKFTWTSQRVAGVAIGTVGLVLGVGFGIGLTVGGANINAGIPGDCPGGVMGTGQCTVPAEQAKRDSDRNQVMLDWAIAGVAFGVGAAAAIAGIIVFAVAPNQASKSGFLHVLPVAVPGGGGVVLGASF